MSTLRTNNLQNPDSSSVNIELTQNGGAIFSGVTTVSSNLNVTGVLTYEDVTNIDSIGVVTARSSVNVGASGNPHGKLHVYTDSLNADNGYNGQNFGIVVETEDGNNDGDEGNGICFTQQYSTDATDSGKVRTGAIIGYKDQASGNFGGGLKFKVQQFGATPLLTSMTMDKTGRIGIGTDNPDATLKVNVASGNNGVVVQNTSTANIALIGARNGDATLQVGQFGSTASGTTFGLSNANMAFIYTTTYNTTHPSALALGTISNKPIVFATNNTERLRITSTGKLEAYKGTSATGKTSGSEAFTVGNGAGNKRFSVYPDGTTVIGGQGTIANNNILLQNDGEAVFGGDVGIGTDNPGEKLHLTTTSGNCKLRIDAASAASVDFYNSGTRFSDMFTDAGTGNFTITNRQNADIIFRTNGTNERLRITTGGNIGIGTTNPGSKLAVHGSITESTDGVTYYPVVTQQDVGLNQNQIPLNQNLGGMAYMDTSNYEQVFEIPATDVTSYFKEGTENIYIGMEGHAPSSVAWPSGSLNQIDVWEIDFQLTYPNMTSGRNDLWMLMYYHNGSSITQAAAVEWNNWVLARASYAGTNAGWNQIQTAVGSNWGKLANYMDAKLFSGQIRVYRGGTNDFTGSNAGQRTGVMWQFNYTHGGVGSTLAFGSGHPTTPSPSQPLAGFTLNADPENAGTVDSNGNSQVFGGYIRQRGFRLQGNI